MIVSDVVPLINVRYCYVNDEYDEPLELGIMYAEEAVKKFGDYTIYNISPVSLDTIGLNLIRQYRFNDFYARRFLCIQ